MKTIIDRSECNPLSDNIEGKLVVIKPHLRSYQKIKGKLKQLTCRRISISLDERIR